MIFKNKNLVKDCENVQLCSKKLLVENIVNNIVKNY